MQAILHFQDDEIFYACVLIAIREMKLPMAETISHGTITLAITVKDATEAVNFGRLIEQVKQNSFPLTTTTSQS